MLPDAALTMGARLVPLPHSKLPGFLECASYASPTAVSAFLDEAIHARIGIRLIAEQHLSLASSYFHGQGGSSSSLASSSMHSTNPDGSIPPPIASPGTIHTDLSPYTVLRHVGGVVTELCQSTLGVAPKLLIEGHTSATYVGVPVHLEYVLTELLKNSFRASVEQSRRRAKEGKGRSRRYEDYEEEEVKPVKVTIAKSKRHLSLRIRDRGGGIHPSDLNRVFSYAFTTAGRNASKGSPSSQDAEAGPYSMQANAGSGGGDSTIDGLSALSASAGLQSSVGTLAGLGYGLPMARLYSTYFGQGSELGIVSLWGEGCDSFVRFAANPL